MILIADAGATKTHWRLLKEEEIVQYSSEGFNYSTTALSHFVDHIPSDIKELQNIGEVHLYISGIQHPDNVKDSDKESLSSFFEPAKVHLYGDQLAAARSLCLNEPGWVGILGTGSNLVYYDGSGINKRIPPLGYVLGDEGSSTYMGKRLLKDHLRGIIPQNISESLKIRYNLTEQIVIEKVYKSGKARNFLSSFSKYLLQNSNDPYVYQLIYSSFEDFFNEFLKKERPQLIHFTGSVAFYFSNILRQVANDQGISLGNITESPIAGLTLYHKQYQNVHD